MKTKRFSFFILILIFLLSACNQKETGKPAKSETAYTKDTTTTEEQDSKQPEEDPEAKESPEQEEPVEQETDGTPDANSSSIAWDGPWTRVGKFNGGSLEIKNVSDKTFGFTLNVADGANIGMIEGNASIEATSATYSDNTTTGESCVLTFSNKENKIVITQTDSCLSYGGNGTTFEGEFVKGDIKPETKTLSDVQIISAKADEQLKKMTGDNYHVFVDNMQMFGEGIKDHDGWGAKVVNGGVRGLYTIKEAIIIIDEKNGLIYAAAIKDGKEVIYYTSNKKYAAQLPKTIEVWREQFTQYPVRYMTK
ncbi:hypothetical protein AWM68_13275 [Fictibacillus phosphorivorans]|uniref:Uncharacterized protein n=1 Tax=Fictibacillus phosphorivorans TaxID=1221500 RepID=A0A163PST4_9BACL|nr:hypothetical protein [Fictibacillus phosphorivorans]KZE64073.1 hypothetical protein AWM68_13275 [Fictibacillus phosphorivorans]